MSYFEFPHTRSYDGDLGYIIKRLNELTEKYGEFMEYNQIKFANPVEWNINTVYPAWNIVFANNDYYIATKPVPAGIMYNNTDYWELIIPFDVDTVLDTESLNPVANSTVARRFNQVSSSISNVVSALQSEGRQREEADTALDIRIAALEDDTEHLSGALTNEQTVRETADTALSRDIDAVNARVDSIAQTIVPGGTTGDAELADIRVAYNDVTYANAGDAVRGVTGDLAEEINYLFNAYKNITWTDNYFINNTNGNEVAISGLSHSDALDVFPGMKLKLCDYQNNTTSDARGLAFYDYQDRYISGIQETGSDINITVPDNAKTMKFTIKTTYKDIYRLMIDISPLYENYSNIKNDVTNLEKHAYTQVVSYTLGGYVNNISHNITPYANFLYSTDVIKLYKGQGIQLVNGISSTATVVDALSAWSADGNTYIKSIEAYTAANTRQTTDIYIASEEIEYIRTCFAQYKGWNPTVLIYDYTTRVDNIMDKEYNDSLLPSIAMFDSVAACGDSYVEAQIWNGSTVLGDFPNLSWGKVIGKLNGIDSYIYASSGANTSNYQERSTCLPAILTDAPRDLYIFCMGINDSSTVTLGTIADITSHESYTDYPNTFYGNYGKIIEQVAAHAPNAKIIIMPPYREKTSSFYTYCRDAVEEICQHYSIGFIDTADSNLANSSFFKDGLSGGHPTAPLQAAMGKDITNLVNNHMKSDYDYYKLYTKSV